MVSSPVNTELTVATTSYIRSGNISGEQYAHCATLLHTRDITVGVADLIILTDKVQLEHCPVQTP